MVYLDSTYEAASAWFEETVIRYVPHAKKEGTISAERYDRYAVATTIGDALKLGSKPQDLLHDFEKKFLIVLEVQPHFPNPTLMSLGKQRCKQIAVEKGLSPPPAAEPAAKRAPAALPQEAAPVKKLNFGGQDDTRAADKADREAERERKEADKAAERERKQAEKDDTRAADKADREAERERKEADKAAERERKQAEKAEKAAEKEEKERERRQKADDGLSQLRRDKTERMHSLMEALGLDLSLAKGLKASPDNIEMMTERLMADRLAQIVLETMEEQSRRITNQEVLAVLKLWHFKKNEARQNVIPGGQKWVHSDTFGLIRCRTGAWCVTSATQEYPHVTKVLNTWFNQRRPAEMAEEFPCTSISLNSNYAAKRHRDGNNAGPSMIAGFGNYTGGELAYWHDDDRTTAVEELNHKDRKVMNISDSLVLFDGCRGHEVDDFQGERFSVVWFCCGKFWTMGKENKDFLRECGFGARENQDMSAIMKFLPPARGYPGCKSLAGMFGGKETRPSAPNNRWTDAIKEEEEKQAAELLSGHAAELKVFVEAKEAFDAAVAAANKAEDDLEAQEQEKENQATALKALFSGRKEAEANVPVSPPPSTRAGADSFLGAMSGEKRRPSSEKAEEAPASKRACPEQLIKETQAPAADLNQEEIRRGDLRALVKALEAGALSDYFSLVLQTSKEAERHLRATLELLAPRLRLPEKALRSAVAQACGTKVGPEDDVTRIMLNKKIVRRTFGGMGPMTVIRVADAVNAAFAVLEEAHSGACKDMAVKENQAAQRLVEVLAAVEGKDAQLLISSLQGETPVARSSIMQALGQAFALVRPGASAGPRPFKSDMVKSAYVDAMAKAVPLAFGELGGRCDELLAALMEDTAPMAMPARCRPTAGMPVLPMQATRTKEVEEGLWRMAGHEVAVEFRYTGLRVQIHRLGDCIAVLDDAQQDLGPALGKESLAALREAIGAKACIIDAVAMCSGEGDAKEVAFHAFDCLWLEGRSLTRQPLLQRHEALRRTVLSCDFLQVAPQERYTVDNPLSAEGASALLEEAKRAQCSGLVLKSLSRSYEAGHSSEAWLSLMVPRA